MSFPVERGRRLRQNTAIRRMVAQTSLSPADLILPLFVREGLSEPAAIEAMPGVIQHTEESLIQAAQAALDAGLAAVMLFGIPERRDANGSGALDPEGILNRSIRALNSRFGDDLVIMADLCLDEFTDHGHCGVLDENGDVDNDRTLDIYAAMALAQARAGAKVVAPSGMMDGQVGVIRTALDKAGFENTVILAYTAKYASAFYGPFREAVDSQLHGDRKTYQMDSANRREALREVEADVAEGADIIMVKPAMTYLDILSDVARVSPVPVAAYQISGEYAMIEAAAGHGWIERQPAIAESLVAIKRAGADLILTYWALEAAQWLREGTFR